MIIGNGLLANNLAKIDKNPNVVFFASGVSNSKCNDDYEFLREQRLLSNVIEENFDKKIVYFSTYSIADSSVSDYKYIHHKKEMEDLIKKKSNEYIIIRTSNIIGEIGNPNTIIRFLCQSILDNKEIEIWKNSYRNILDIDDLVTMVNELLIKNLDL